MTARLPRSAEARLWIIVGVAVLGLGPALGHLASEGPADGRTRHPAAIAAERSFFEAFDRGERSPEILRPLAQAWAMAPADARTNLLLGLAHLWLVAESDRTEARIIEHLLLADSYLVRAARLDPSNGRMASWIAPTRIALAQLEGDEEAAAAALESLREAYADDPNFHSFTLAMLAFGAPRDSPRFAEGLKALRTVAGSTCHDDDPSCRNTPRWPHNREAYLTFTADFELKAGHPERAVQLLELAMEMPGAEDWPYRSEASYRLDAAPQLAALYADDDPLNDPPSLIETHACTACHQGTARGRK
ncbi:MAG: hypothetical protein AAGN46_02125 [Acidobacteriota bacterium]